MTNSVAESALIEAAAIEEVAMTLPPGDNGRAALERQVALLRTRGIKFLEAEENETEEQWARRLVAEAMRFPLKGPTRWYPIVLEVMYRVGARRQFHKIDYHGYSRGSGGVVYDALSIYFEPSDPSNAMAMVDEASRLFAVIGRHLTDRSEIEVDGNSRGASVDILIPTGISHRRLLVLEDLDIARQKVEEAAKGHGKSLLPDDLYRGDHGGRGRQFLQDMADGKEVPLASDDMLLFLSVYGLGVPNLLFNTAHRINAIRSPVSYVIYGNTVVTSFEVSSMRHAAAGVVYYPVSCVVAIPILRDFTDPDELEIPLSGVFDIQIGRPIDHILPGSEFPHFVHRRESEMLGNTNSTFDTYDSEESREKHRNLVRSIQEDFDAGRDEFAEEVLEQTFDMAEAAFAYVGLKPTFVEDPSAFHEWIAAGHAVPYYEFVVGVNVDAVRNPFMKLEKKWAEYEADYKVKYPQMFKDREIEALWAVLEGKGVKPWKYSRRMNPKPPTRHRIRAQMRKSRTAMIILGLPETLPHWFSTFESHVLAIMDEAPSSGYIFDQLADWDRRSTAARNRSIIWANSNVGLKSIITTLRKLKSKDVWIVSSSKLAENLFDSLDAAGFEPAMYTATASKEDRP